MKESDAGLQAIVQREAAKLTMQEELLWSKVYTETLQAAFSRDGLMMAPTNVSGTAAAHADEALEKFRRRFRGSNAI